MAQVSAEQHSVSAAVDWFWWIIMAQFHFVFLFPRPGVRLLPAPKLLRQFWMNRPLYVLSIAVMPFGLCESNGKHSNRDRTILIEKPSKRLNHAQAAIDVAKMKPNRQPPRVPFPFALYSLPLRTSNSITLGRTSPKRSCIQRLKRAIEKCK